MRPSIAHPIGLVGVVERGGLVVVMGAVGFGAVAELCAAPWLSSTGLDVVEWCGAGHGLTCNHSGRRSDVCVGECEAVSIFTQEPVRTI